MDSGNSSKFLRSWSWKREHRPDEYRFDKPYTYKLNNTTTNIYGIQGDVVAVVDGIQKLVLQQSRFSPEGFASTIWDSSIVIAKYLEKHPQIVKNKRCLDLSAGCGLVGICMSKLGAKEVVLTDLPQNLDLLNANVKLNQSLNNTKVVSYWWGDDIDNLGGSFDVVVACDVMYREDVVDKLAKSIINLCTNNTEVFIAHGRNRGAWDKFVQLIQNFLKIDIVSEDKLDEVHQCEDVDVLRITNLQS